MQKYDLTKDEFEHEEFTSSVYKNFYPKLNLLKGVSRGDLSSTYEYDEKNRVLIESIHDSIRGDEFWDKYFKVEYVYFNKGYRKFLYLIGYKSSHDINTQDQFGKIIELPFYQANELHYIEEVKLDSNGNILIIDKYDLEGKRFEKEENSYDGDLLIKKIDSKQQLTAEYHYNTDKSLCHIIFNNTHQYSFKYDSRHRIIERTFSTIEDQTIFKLLFTFENDILKKISSEKYIVESENFNDFFLPEISEIIGESLKLPSNYFNRFYLMRNQDYIEIEYSRSKPSKITGYNNVGIEEEKLLLFYETINNGHLEVVDGFHVENNEMVKLFSHKKYFE